MTKNFYDVVEGRRTIYGLSDEFVISDERLQEVLHIAIKSAPLHLIHKQAVSLYCLRIKTRILEISF